MNEIKSACDAVYTAVSLKKVEHSEAVRSLLRKLSLVVRVRRTIGLSSVITLFHNLIYSDLVTDDKEIIDNLLFGLEQLIEETKLSNNILGCSTNQCLQLRATANMLAYIMYKKFVGNEMITSRLLPWKELSCDLNEFSEVRNRWISI